MIAGAIAYCSMQVKPFCGGMSFSCSGSVSGWATTRQVTSRFRGYECYGNVLTSLKQWRGFRRQQ